MVTWTSWHYRHCTIAFHYCCWHLSKTLCSQCSSVCNGSMKFSSHLIKGYPPWHCSLPRSSSLIPASSSCLGFTTCPSFHSSLSPPCLSLCLSLSLEHCLHLDDSYPAPLETGDQPGSISCPLQCLNVYHGTYHFGLQILICLYTFYTMRRTLQTAAAN